MKYLLIITLLILSGCMTIKAKNCKAIGPDTFQCDMTVNPFCPSRFDCDK